jgi:non-ribosomal peptide synthetase component F
MTYLQPIHNHCLHQIFEAQVTKNNQAIALTFKGQNITYNELNIRANQLAYHLQNLGVKPEVMVGLYLESSLEMIISILAILKAGGAYVPLDAAYPVHRLYYKRYSNSNFNYSIKFT